MTDTVEVPLAQLLVGAFVFERTPDGLVLACRSCKARVGTEAARAVRLIHASDCCILAVLERAGEVSIQLGQVVRRVRHAAWCQLN
jgi:hypothetical protein